MISRGSKDIEAWTALAIQVERAIQNPRLSMVALEKAAHKARHAVFPCDPCTAVNPWNLLLREAISFAGQLTVSRVDMASSLEAAFLAAQAHCPLIAVAPPPPPAEAPDRPPQWWDRD